MQSQLNPKNIQTQPSSNIRNVNEIAAFISSFVPQQYSWVERTANVEQFKL